MEQLKSGYHLSYNITIAGRRSKFAFFFPMRCAMMHHHKVMTKFDRYSYIFNHVSISEMRNHRNLLATK